METKFIEDRQLWNDFMASSPYSNISQSHEWGELGSFLNQDPLRFGVLDDQGQLVAAVLIFVTTAPVIHQPYFYAPRGPVVADPDSPALSILLNFVRTEARKRGAFMLKLEPGVPEGDSKWLSTLARYGFQATPHTVNVRHEWVLDISPDEKTILAGMKEKWRYNIRLAGRKGVTIRRSESKEDIATFYEIYKTTSSRDNFSIHSDIRYYEKIIELYQSDDRAALFIAEFEGEPLAALFALRLGEWCWYMYGASSNSKREKMPNHLLQWTAMQWAKSHGCKFYNFRGIPEILSEDQEMYGIYLYKRGFGGQPWMWLQVHDLPYKPLVYLLYRRLLDFKRWQDHQKYKKLHPPKSSA